MSIVRVQTDTSQYPIHIASDAIAQLSTSIPSDASSILLVSNHTVNQLYGEKTKKALQDCNKPIYSLSIADGETYKTLATLEQVYTFMLSQGLDRKSVVIALGGGVVGDLVGFAAATYMRGIRLIQVPTTLLSQVDSSVGGKTAVNHALGKNMIGAFYQPIAVHIDIGTLKTLPKREISAGLAEVIKYGLIMDADFFKWCENHINELVELEPEAIEYAITQSCQFKAKVVAADEKEGGVRAILNFGHTFGHAIEAGLGYGKWLHGEAVGCGMVQAAELSARVCGFPEKDVMRIRSLVQKIGCPTVAPHLGTDLWIKLMQLDKKSVGQKINFVLLEEIGSTVVRTVAHEDLVLTLQKTTGEFV